ncbi:peroxisomal biogenesis factor 3 [Strongylocentrotus purpuratus]|uniref:Peroxisomal biogenesis factor 3 n=1 Tax=Strongylocentrotus purpuratus TaxID=7668 RepID=A0A7M7NQC9_STRPU|nr:peroxisomal biogenesis factor 3 [Strongylocentrotus purpuratus]
MLGSIWNFVKRHRRKFLVLGAVAGGASLLYKYAEWKLKEWRETEEAECLAMARRAHHFESNQRTCNMTVLSMIPKLRELLLYHLNSEELIQKLKSGTENKVVVWNELKVVSFTRMVVSVYSTVLLTAFLRVQLNILGGYMYLDTLAGKNGLTYYQVHATQDVQKEYLAMVQYLLTDGLTELINHVQEVVQNVVGSISLQQLLSLSDMEEIIAKVRGQVETTQYGGEVVVPDCSIHPLGRYLLKPEGLDGEESACRLSDDQLVLSQMQIETRDLVESHDFSCVMNSCLDIGFSRLLDNMAEFFRPVTTRNGESPCGLKLAMAKAIPIVNGQVNALCCDTPNHFIQELLLMQCVKDFASNVYEGFSQPPAHEERNGDVRSPNENGSAERI